MALIAIKTLQFSLFFFHFFIQVLIWIERDEYQSQFFSLHLPNERYCVLRSRDK